jgi:large repetitive protein
MDDAVLDTSSARSQAAGGTGNSDADAAQKTPQTATRVDTNETNATASSVAAVAGGMSLFFAFDKSAAADMAATESPDVDPSTDRPDGAEVPVAASETPAFAGADAVATTQPGVDAATGATAPAAATPSRNPVDPAPEQPAEPPAATLFSGAQPADIGVGPVSSRSAPIETAAPAVLPDDQDLGEGFSPDAPAGPAPNLYAISEISDADASADSVDENAAIGSRVGIVALATDGDAADSVTYSLSETAGDRFAIDPVTGVITVAGALDYETADHYDIEVTATSSDGSTATRTYTITLNDINEFAVSALSDTDGSANAVDENAAIGTSVGITAFASDSDGTDSVSYSLSNNAGGRFAIDQVTGEVTVAGSLDREAAASYQIEVTATSTDGSTSTQSYTIALNDVDEFDVTPVTDADGSANTLAENAAAGTTVGVVAAASDADATNSAVSYSVDDARFTVDADGTVRVADGAVFDHETEASIEITVTATSADGSTSSQAFTLAVSDVNEAAVSAISDGNNAANAIDENAAIGTSVGITAFASDSDGTDSVSYSLSDDAGGRFAIDPVTGEVTVAGALDRETAASYQIEVTATSTDGSTSTQTYTIALNDIDEFDVSPVTDSDASANTLAENAAAGTTVGVVASASDADATNSAVSYSVDDARFTVDADGTVRVADGAVFDHETEASIDITVTATSADGSSSSQAFTLAVSDVNEAAVSALSDTDGSANAVDENAAIGTSVGITAFAEDTDGTDSVSYSLSDDADVALCH